jgi:hypothetical protein
MYEVNGGCHCGNILLSIELSRPPGEYNPRTCDCEFCRKHGASYVSDPHGALLIRVKDRNASRHYRQGSGLADFLLCGNCGVLAGVCYLSDGRLYGTANVRALDTGADFGPEQAVSPKKLSAGGKVDRWLDNWFSTVRVLNVDE